MIMATALASDEAHINVEIFTLFCTCKVASKMIVTFLRVGFYL